MTTTDESDALSPRHRALLAAAADRIVPADDYPSAAEAGAVDYVCRLLVSDLRDRLTTMTAGLDELDRAAEADTGVGFVEASPARQDQVLAILQQGTNEAARAFVTWLVELVLESYYADPANGGNAGAVSWRMIGYEPRVPGYTPEAG